MDEVASLYAPEFIAASPAGIAAGKNDDQFKQTYARENQADTAIDFEVHYLVQKLGNEAKAFGWISGDEQALLRDSGIV